VSPDPDLTLALELADDADAIALGRFRSRDLRVETKPDLSPVTQADREIEEAIRARLAHERAEDGVFGEELGAIGDSDRRWIVDPIDGTRNFARGVPVWATLVALEQDEVVQLGVVSAPALGRRWWAARGQGAFAGAEQIRVSRVTSLADAALSVAADDVPTDLARRSPHVRHFGDFWAHMLVAEGAIDGAVNSLGEAVWDLAAVQVIVEEAGGRFTDRAGARRIDGGSAVSSNGALHETLLAALSA
jgi:histidinol-phosphatase